MTPEGRMDPLREKLENLAREWNTRADACENLLPERAETMRDLSDEIYELLNPLPPVAQTPQEWPRWDKDRDQAPPKESGAPPAQAAEKKPQP